MITGRKVKKKKKKVRVMMKCAERLSEVCVECIDPYAVLMTMTSSQFHGSLRKVNFPTQTPRATIFMMASSV